MALADEEKFANKLLDFKGEIIMPEPIKDDEQKTKQDFNIATEKLPQPFKFVATLLFITLPQTSKAIQAIIVLLFALLIIVFSLATLKELQVLIFSHF